MLSDTQAVANAVTVLAQLMVQVILLEFHTKFGILQLQMLVVAGTVDVKAIFEQLTWHCMVEAFQ
jgi:hypothetical protein